MDKKTVTAISVTAVIGLLIAGIWETFFRGIEGNVADNPAILAVQVSAKENAEAIQEIQIYYAGIDAKLGLVITNQNMILDKLTPPR